MSAKGKLMNRCGLMAVLFIASTPIVAAKAALDFKGFPLGGRVEAFKQKFPSFQCKPTQEHQIACDSYRETYAGVDADIILVSFANGKLQSFQVDGTGADKKSKILAALKEKYGEPSSDDNQATQWELPNGNCRLLSGLPLKFQLVCVSDGGLPKGDQPANNDI
jgi:hypothetical protein